jgi:hypothetical protein
MAGQPKEGRVKKTRRAVAVVVAQVLALALVQALALALPPAAWADECGTAVIDYNAVLPHLNEAMAHYASCVANSLGNDDCAREFARVRAAQGEFSSVVAIYKKQCL